ncbi:protransforming growth factor alpha [Sphaerodactylus townsendi]|uniref:protransforming growth factor alpha n=1 Tax=Sphaerodactylus townsendi TaxID=933632 RepID=UPI002025D641|nr:protransforming growth factor alpha [Sphaerodactylus townsendi]
MVSWVASELALLTLGILVALCHALENTTLALTGPPVAAAVISHFNSCPDAHSEFCFHGTCRFLVQEEKPTCLCHSGFMGTRCEHADLLAVVAANQKQQTITALVVVSIVASAVLIMICVLIHCCRIKKRCEWCRTVICRHEKPNGLLKGGTSCCHSETVV